MLAPERTHIPHFSKSLLDELEKLDKALIDACKEILHQENVSTEEVLVLLKNHGCNLSTTIMYLLATGRFSLKTAKDSLHASTTWGDEIRAHDRLIYEYIEELSKESRD